MDFQMLIEIAIIPVVLLLIEAWRDRKRAREELASEVTVRKTVDQTDLTRIVIDQNTLRHDQIVADLREMRDKLDEAIRELTAERMENLHLRHLLGIGPMETIPPTREALSVLLRDRHPLPEPPEDSP